MNWESRLQDGEADTCNKHNIRPQTSLTKHCQDVGIPLMAVFLHIVFLVWPSKVFFVKLD